MQSQACQTQAAHVVETLCDPCSTAPITAA
jgi:hypothetical protein